MDGTLTLPHSIDFDLMYRRVMEAHPSVAHTLKRKGGDILAEVAKLETPEERANARAIIDDEERLGAERMVVRPELPAFLSYLQKQRIRVALSTRNNAGSVDIFAQKASLIGSSAIKNMFVPAVDRDSLQGINKPDPRVAFHIFERWELDASTEAADVWFVGDSTDDMNCGKRAGCKTCLIRTSYNGDLEKEPGLVDLAVDNLIEFASRGLGIDVAPEVAEAAAAAAAGVGDA